MTQEQSSNKFTDHLKKYGTTIQQITTSMLPHRRSKHRRCPQQLRGNASKSETGNPIHMKKYNEIAGR
jgi:hypothetical protein